MRLKCLFLACLVAVASAALGNEENTEYEKWKAIIPPPVVIMPPGKGLCLKHLPKHLCSIRPGGGRGLAQRASRSLVNRLKKKGWTFTEKLPTHINAIHFCCQGKKFAMEKTQPDEKLDITPPPTRKRPEVHEFDVLKFAEATTSDSYLQRRSKHWNRKHIEGQLSVQDLVKISLDMGPEEPHVARKVML